MEGLCLPFSSRSSLLSGQSCLALLGPPTKGTVTGVGVRALVLAPLRVGGTMGPESSKCTEAPALFGSLAPGEQLASGLRAEERRSVPQPCSSIAKPTTARVRTTTVTGVETRPSSRVGWA